MAKFKILIIESDDPSAALAAFKEALFPSFQQLPPILQAITNEVCAHYKLTPQEVLGTKRGTSLVTRCRMVIIYLVRLNTELSLPEIGAAFSRNHSSIHDAYGSINRQLRLNSVLADDLDTLTKTLQKKGVIS